MVNRDKSICDNLSPSARVDSIADKPNLFQVGNEHHMVEKEEPRQYCNLSNIVARREGPGGPGMYTGPNVDWEIGHAYRRQNGPGGLAFDRGSVLPQPPRDRDRD